MKEKALRFITQKECKKFSLSCGQLMESIFFQALMRLILELGKLRLHSQLDLLPKEKLKRYSIGISF
jgi:hypothetical protein